MNKWELAAPDQLIQGEAMAPNMVRTAACACGGLSVTCAGEPVRISICHCLDCQKRTGSVFSTQARFPHAAVTVSGASSIFRRKGDSDNHVSFHFCPNCGSTVWWELESAPGVIAVAIGAFADSRFPAPLISVYESRRHHWVDLESLPVREHLD